MDWFLNALVPLWFFGLMFTMGLELRVVDFQRIVTQPRAALVGLSGQFLGLPLLWFLLGLVLHVSPEVGIGMALVAVCPGGPVSNALVYLAGGHVALSVSLTAVSNVIAVVTVPFVINLSAQVFSQTALAVSLPLGPTMGQLVVLSLIPLTLGMSVLARWSPFALRIRQPAKRVVGLLFPVIVGLLMIRFWEPFWTHAAAAVVPILAWLLAALGLGTLGSRLVRTSRADAFTIAIELAIQNVPLALVMATTLLNRPEFLPPVVVYAFLQLPLVIAWSAGFWALQRKNLGYATVPQ